MVARSITDPDRQARALAGLVTAVAGTDPDRAEMVARSITDPDQQARALAGLVTAVAGTDPDRARQVAEAAEAAARSITDPDQQAQALVAVASRVEPDPCVPQNSGRLEHRILGLTCGDVGAAGRVAFL
jgi:hypothetical protein